MHTEKAKIFEAMRPLTARRLGAWPVRRLPEGARRGEELRCRDLLRPAAFHRLMALGGSAVVLALRQIPARYRHRGTGGIESRRHRALFADSAPATGRANYLRFRLSPSAAIALAARVELAGKEFVGEQKELYLVEEQSGEEAPYERLLGDAMAGDGALFTREDAVEAAWAVVDPVLKAHHRVRPIGAELGAEEADTIIASDGGWHNPKPKEASGR